MITDNSKFDTNNLPKMMMSLHPNISMKWILHGRIIRYNRRIYFCIIFFCGRAVKGSLCPPFVFTGGNGRLTSISWDMIMGFKSYLFALQVRQLGKSIPVVLSPCMTPGNGYRNFLHWNLFLINPWNPHRLQRLQDPLCGRASTFEHCYPAHVSDFVPGGRIR